MLMQSGIRDSENPQTVRSSPQLILSLILHPLSSKYVMIDFLCSSTMTQSVSEMITSCSEVFVPRTHSTYLCQKICSSSDRIACTLCNHCPFVSVNDSRKPSDHFKNLYFETFPTYLPVAFAQLAQKTEACVEYQGPCRANFYAFSLHASEDARSDPT